MAVMIVKVRMQFVTVLHGRLMLDATSCPKNVSHKIFCYNTPSSIHHYVAVASKTAVTQLNICLVIQSQPVALSGQPEKPYADCENDDGTDSMSRSDRGVAMISHDFSIE